MNTQKPTILEKFLRTLSSAIQTEPEGKETSESNILCSKALKRIHSIGYEAIVDIEELADTLYRVAIDFKTGGITEKQLIANSIGLLESCITDLREHESSVYRLYKLIREAKTGTIRKAKNAIAHLRLVHKCWEE